MNFFERQHHARRKTATLIAYFLIAVILTVVTINLALYFLFFVTQGQHAATQPGDFPHALTLGQWLNEPYWIWTTIAVLLVISFSSVRSYFQLSGGGKAVAEMVSARRIRMASEDIQERRLINVVEEMSIASGTPVPLIYVMDDEQAINAFVAGYRPSEAVLVVTKGTLEKLSRDELQGVVGHEYSHILNGDMRINVRLIAALAGIIALGQMGGFVLRSLRYSRGRDSKGGVGVIIGVGLVLFVVGYVGLFFGRLIKAAISRQREFLADASSVQFTRNPSAIAGALWQIKTDGGSRLVSSHAEDMSHMCIAESLDFSSLMATHPPLDERIEAVDPGFLTKKRFEHKKIDAATPQTGTANTSSTTPSSPLPDTAMGFSPEQIGAVAVTSAAITQSVGNPTGHHIEFAEQMHAAMPQSLLDAAHAPEQAKNVVYALILNATQSEAIEVALTLINAHDGDTAKASARALVPTIGQLGPRGRLPVLDIVIPALKELSPNECARFLRTVDALVKVDKRLTSFEFVMTTILENHLDEDATRADITKYYQAELVLPEIRVLLTVMARAGTKDESVFHQVFARTMGYFSSAEETPVDRSHYSPERLRAVLQKLALVSPLIKQNLIGACADCVLHDGVVMPVEAELLRATALALDCPMPPLVTS